MKLRERFLNANEDICEIIADDFAIEFGNWLNNKIINPNGIHNNLLGVAKVSQLFKIFKKEKEL